MNNYPTLFSPLKIGTVTAKNRIMSPPMSPTELSHLEGLSKDNISFFEQIAKGGAAIVTIGESIIPTKNGKTHTQQLMLGEDKIMPSLVEVTDAIHSHNALASIEISHGGATADPAYNNGSLSWGPVGFVDEYGDEILGMDEAMMNEVADSFAEAVQTVKTAGFDMAMIHAGHGWLLYQFLSPIYNTRTDNYGGSIENRARFPLMVLERIRQKVGRAFPLDMRISGDECDPGGIELEDVVKFVQLAEPYIDIVNVSAAYPWSDSLRMCIPIFQPRGVNVYLAEAVKKGVSIPVSTVGGFVDPEHMEEILASGKADVIAVARGLFADPYLPKKAKAGKEKEIAKCIRCFVCNQTGYSTRARKCSINPLEGRQYDYRSIPAVKAKKRVLVAGGGPGGLKAAETAAVRGHEVILCEKSDALGGALKFAAYVDFKYDLKNYADHLAYMAEKNGVDIRLNTAVTPELVAEIKPDVLIVAIGAESIIPPIPGIDGKNVVVATNLFDEGVEIGDRVAIIGGGLVGCEFALHLADQGKSVTIVEMLGDVAIDATNDHRRGMLPLLEEKTEILTSTRVTAVTDKGIEAVTAEGEKITVEADTVLLSAGMRALSKEVDALRVSGAGDVIVIGDCKQPKKVMEAVRSGFDAAMDIGTDEY